jgi:hypothetical protein
MGAPCRISDYQICFPRKILVLAISGSLRRKTGASEAFFFILTGGEVILALPEEPEPARAWATGVAREEKKNEMNGSD